jgi:site-specific DNA-cytosine methylase
MTELLTPPHEATTVAVPAQPYTMEDVRRASSARKFTVVSTFAGGGGSCIGYKLAGGHVVLINEFVPEAVRTYATNFPDAAIDTRDIRELTADAASMDAFLARAGLRRGELDMLNGSPPCCEFSIAGKGPADPDEMRPYSDTKQKGTATLILDFFKLARHARPRVVIGENVPALKSRYGKFFEGALDVLRYADAEHTRRLYFVNSAVLSSEGFGVPQKRGRLFFIGVREDVAQAVGITDDAGVTALFPEPSDHPIGIRSAFAGLRQGHADVHPWLRTASTGSLARVIARFPRNPSKLLRANEVGLTETRWSMARCAWDHPAPTLAVTGQRPDALSGALHPDADRKFTITELKRLFALPDDYALTGTLRQGAERICRMVPPRVMQAIAERVHAKVLQPHAEGLS